MGMDVYGQNPANKTGEYFRRNIWGWRPLADYTTKAAPDITAGCRYWHTNDSDGLDATQSVKLADALQTEVDSGRTADYVEERDAALAALPRVECWLCHGAGISVGLKSCNGCEGLGDTEHSDTHYPLYVEDVQQWITFLRSCGGFKIH